MHFLRSVFLPLFILPLFSPLSVSNSSQWALKKNKDGIAVYTRPLAGSNLSEVKVVNKVRSSLSAIVALFLDTKNYPNWMYGCGSVSNLKTISEKELYNYQVTDLPWPFSDRDVVAHFTVTQDASTGTVTFLKTGMPDYIPEKDGLVRVRNFESKYTLTRLKGDSVQLELQIHLDPGGNIPAWLYNDNVVNGPYQTTIALIKELPKYQSASYAFIREH